MKGKGHRVVSFVQALEMISIPCLKKEFFTKLNLRINCRSGGQCSSVVEGLPAMSEDLVQSSTLKKNYLGGILCLFFPSLNIAVLLVWMNLVGVP
jgi:hypothetical protein